MSEVRVLVVDDDELFRQTMAAVVDATDGFVMAGSATTGEESLHAAESWNPDLVLMDVNLPGIDGTEATRQILSRRPRPVVLLLSTYDERDVDFLDCGAAGYITKSAFGPDRLVEAWIAASAEQRLNDTKKTP